MDGFIFNSKTTRNGVYQLVGNSKPIVIAYPPTYQFGEPITEKEIKTSRHRSKAGYLAGYFLLFLSVLAAVVIVKNAGTPELQNPPGTGQLFRIEAVPTPSTK